MKALRILIGAALGIIGATVFSWGGLYLFGTIVLHGHGSLFDTNPTAANIFFGGWFALCAIAAIGGGYTAHRLFNKK